MDIPAIRVDALRKRYGRHPAEALAGVSLNVGQGEVYGLLGRNGAGKSTLVKILLDIVRASSGSAELLGIPVRSTAARQAVGYLPEDHRLPEYRTGEGLLHHYAMLSGVGWDRRVRVPEMLDRVGLSDAARRMVRSYSKGMKQRLGLAQALVHRPRLVLLDEPTDGVDPVGRAQVRDLLRELVAGGVTIFLNSHLLSEVESLCDRVGILDRGRLVREGTVAALTSVEQVFTLRSDPGIDAATRAAIAAIAVQIEGDNATGWRVTVADASDIDRVVDVLRARHIGIRTLIAERLTLEEVFLRSVGPGSDPS